jgi:hypothetical protein
LLLLTTTPERTLCEGLKYVGFDEGRQSNVKHEKNVERFRAFYGVGHRAVTSLLMDLQTSSRPSAQVHDVDLKHFFLALYFLKTYDTELVLSGWWGLHEITIRKWTWFYATKIQALKEDKVSSF